MVRMAKENNDSEAMTSDLGSLLREYRELAGYSLTQMADALCLPDETLENLENEEFQTLPEPPYVRGYLRNYANLADKDSAELINAYESLRGADPSDLDYHFKPKPTILTDSQSKISPVMGQLLLLSLLLVFIVGISMIPAVNQWITNTWKSLSDQTNQQDNPNNQDLIGSMPIPTLLATDEKPVESGIQTNTENSENSSTTEATNNNTQTDANTTKPANIAQQESTQANEQVTEANQTTAENGNGNENIRIKLIFNMEVWMKIQDASNKTVFEGLNAAGGSKDLNLIKPLHFRVGNAQGLSLFVDDKAVDISSYIKGSVAKFTLE